MTMVGILLGANRATRLFTNGLVGFLYERKSKRPLLAFSLVLGALASVIYSLRFGFWPLFIGRMVWGLGWSFQWIGCRTMILEVSESENRATMSGLYQMFFLGGVGFASLAGSFMVEKIGFRTGQQISAVVILVAAVMWYVFLPDVRVEKKGDDQKAATKPARGFFWPVIVPAVVVMFIVRFIERGVLAATSSLWISSLFSHEIKIFGILLTAVGLSGIYNAIKFLPSMANAPLVGFISDRLRKRWVVIAATLILISVGLFLMSRELIPLALFGGLLVASFNGSAETLVPVIVGDEVKVSAIPRTLGVIYIGADLGAMLGPMAALAVVDSAFLSVHEIYISCIGLLIFAAVISLAVSRREKLEVEESTRKID